MVWSNVVEPFNQCPEPRVVYVRTFLLWNVGWVWIEKEKQVKYDGLSGYESAMVS
jgi:hypothetical protein